MIISELFCLAFDINTVAGIIVYRSKAKGAYRLTANIKMLYKSKCHRFNVVQIVCRSSARFFMSSHPR